MRLTPGDIVIGALGIGTLGWIGYNALSSPTRTTGGGGGGGGTTGGDTPPPASAELDGFGVPYAIGSSSPLWPLPDDRRSRTEKNAKGVFVWARGRVTADFGDPRPYGAAKPTRHHAGEDLRAPRGSIIRATERGHVTLIDEDWFEGTGALLIAFESGITANFGEVLPGSALAAGLAVGTVVDAGQVIARVGATAMLHFELYRGVDKRTHQWPWLGPVPAELLDPTRYLELAAKTVPA